MKVVLDASAIIAYRRNEPGGDLVARHLRSDHLLLAHALNFCEVYYDFYRAGERSIAVSAIADLRGLGVVERSDMDAEFWGAMGYLKAVHKRVSLADCAAVALTKLLSAVLLTTDRHELKPLSKLGVCDIEFIR